MLMLNNLKQQIADLVNKSQLPVDAVYFLFKDLYIEIENLYRQEIIKEQQQKQIEEQKKEENKEESDN